MAFWRMVDDNEGNGRIQDDLARKHALPPRPSIASLSLPLCAVIRSVLSQKSKENHNMHLSAGGGASITYGREVGEWQGGGIE